MKCTEDKIQMLWHLKKQYSNNIMFDVQASYDYSKYILPVVLLKEAAYLPFVFEGLEIRARCNI